jgi:jouberin
MIKTTFIELHGVIFFIIKGFLRPVGIGKTHIGKTKIELYKYKFRNKKADPSFHNSYVPSVYYDFIWNNHEKYDGFLTVQLIPT